MDRSTLAAGTFALLTMLAAASPAPALAAELPGGAALHDLRGPIVAIDDAQQRIELRAPAQRVVALAPNLVELAYAAGGGTHLVGVVTYSDYPPEARRVARIGDANALDLERIAALRPDLILAWWHGNPPRQIEQLRALGIPVFQSAPATLDAIPATLDTLGRLLGTADRAHVAAQALRERIGALRRRYAGRPRVSVFYQVWSEPLLTLDGKQIISDAIAVCGGRNVFASLAQLVPSVSTEAVLAADPQAIVTAAAPAASSTDASLPLARWHAWPQISAVAHGNLFALDGDSISRPGPRMVDATEALCIDLDQARQRLAGRAPN